MSKKTFQESFSINSQNYRVVADFDFSDELFTPRSYNINHNFLLRKQVSNENESEILICLESQKSDLIISNIGSKKYKILGDFTTEPYQDNFTLQNSLFGINGPLNRVILHSLEKDLSVITLHACALMHSESSKIVIGFGHSGSGKSVLITSALDLGWELVASEYVTISSSGTLYRGNCYDNISAKSVCYVEENLNRAILNRGDILSAPLLNKVFVDFSNYQVKEAEIPLKEKKLIIAFLGFGSSGYETGFKISDQAFLNRSLLQNASEKILMPIIFRESLAGTGKLDGDYITRTLFTKKLIDLSSDAVVLSGGVADFNSWIKRMTL